MVIIVGSSCSTRNLPGDRTPEQRGFQDFYPFICEMGYYIAQKPFLLECKTQNPLSKPLLLALCVVLGPEIFVALYLDHLSFALSMPR